MTRPAAVLAAAALLLSACLPPSGSGEEPPATARRTTTSRAPATTAPPPTTAAPATSRATTTTAPTTTLPDRCASAGTARTGGFVGLEVGVVAHENGRWVIGTVKPAHYTFLSGGEEIPVPVAAAWKCPDGEMHLDICRVSSEDRLRLMRGQPAEIVRSAQRAAGAADDGIWGPLSNRALDGFCAEMRGGEEEEAPEVTAPTTTRPRPTTTLRRVVSSGTISGWHIKLLHVNSNANSAMRNANMFNPDPPAGGKFALMSVEVRYLGEGKESTAYDINFSAIDRRGNEYGNCGMAIVPGEYDAYTEHFSGASQTGNLCFEVPASVSDLRLKVSDAGLFASDEIILESR